jgi:hypothetical protein
MSNYATLLAVKKSVIKMGIKIHNLPSELKRTENFKGFKNKLKSYLLQNCFYSLQEFFFSNNDGLWTIIFTKRVMLYYMADLCFWWFNYIYCFILNC